MPTSWRALVRVRLSGVHLFRDYGILDSAIYLPRFLEDQ